MGSGLVGLRVTGQLMSRFFPVSGDSLTLGTAVLPGASLGLSYVDVIHENIVRGGSHRSSMFGEFQG